MKFSSGVQNFWSQLKNYGLSSAVTIAIAFWLWGFEVGVIITIFLTLCFLWLLSDIKEKMLRALPDTFEYDGASLEEYPLLNFKWLNEQSEQLENLGFVKLMDYKTGKQSGFGRCFSHPTQYCYAEVHEVFKTDGESFSRSGVIFSILTDDWSLSAINRPPSQVDSLPYGLWRHPKNVRIYAKVKDSNWQELFHQHLDFRQQMLRKINISLVLDVSWDFYVENQQKSTVFRKQSIRNKILLLAMIEVSKFELNPKSEWLGDYAKYLKP